VVILDNCLAVTHRHGVGLGYTGPDIWNEGTGCRGLRVKVRNGKTFKLLLKSF